MTIHNVDNQLDINAIPNCLTNRGKGSVGCSRETNNFANNLDQQKTRNEDISTDTRQTLVNGSNINLVELVQNHRYWNGKLETLIKWLGYSNR